MIRRLATLALVVGACALVVTLSAAGGKGARGTTIKIAFSNAFGLTEGGDLRVGGVQAGATTKFDVSKGPECQLGKPEKKPPRACAIVTAEVTEPGLASFRKDASCSIRQQSLIGEYYVDCQPGNDKELLGKRTIPDTNTHSTIPADLVNNVLRRPYRDRLRLIIAELGTGLAGRPEDIRILLHQAHPGLRATDRTLKILAQQRDTIKRFISESNTVVAELNRKRRDVARWIRTAGRTAEISASRRAEIAAGFERLPTFLDELRPTMVRLSELTEAQTPLLRELQVAAPELTTLFERLGPFAEASRPAFRSLGELSVTGTRALRESRQEIRTLRQLAKDAPATGKPLRQFLQTLDDRSRAFDNDPRAAASAPPSPDPTSIAKATGKKGFTGFEGVLAYFYWQTLAINEFDSISHFLRVLGIESDACSPYANDVRPASLGGTREDADEARECASYLGTHQPGITDPDPTADDGNGINGSPGVDDEHPEKGRVQETGKSRRGRGPGDPEAPRRPGQPDYSVPNPTLPPSVQELLDNVARGGNSQNAAPGVPPVDDPTQALDFLLGP